MAGNTIGIDFRMDRAARYRNHPIFNGGILPVYHASGRVLSILRERSTLFGQELNGSRKVLIAAAFT